MRRSAPASAWSLGHAAVEAAIRRADAVIQLNPTDVACVQPLLAEPGRLSVMKPFLDGAPYRAAARERTSHRARLAQRLKLDPAKPWLLAVGMMREGDKLASYRVLANALGWLTRLDWQLVAVGDGPARGAVEAALAPLGWDRLRFTGLIAREHLPEIYAAADLLVWPAISEAYGMAMLEAQAAGLPVVAGDTGGVRRSSRTAPPAGSCRSAMLRPWPTPSDLAIADPAVRRKWARAAIKKMLAEHDLESAARTLDGVLRRLVPSAADAEARAAVR